MTIVDFEEFKQDLHRMCTHVHKVAVAHMLPDPVLVLPREWETPVKIALDMNHVPDKKLQYCGIRIEFGVVRNTPVNVIER